MTMTGQLCGSVGDGCGGSIDCGGCSGGLTCGGAGTPSVCGAARDSGACTATQCSSANGTYCGVVGDGCGGSIDCGTCPGQQVCGVRTSHVCNAPCPLCAQIPQCGTTTITGTAFTGALVGPDPVYNALVYIPNVPIGTVLPPLSDALACDQCKALTPDEAIASAITGPDGSFELKNVPAGNNIPLIVQLGKWRRQITVNVTPCAVNALTAGTVRLPSKKSEGDIPLTAISTGGADTLECILRKMGVDDTEFTIPSGTGRIHWYRATGAAAAVGPTPDQTALWTDINNLEKYNMVLLPCEHAPNTAGKAPGYTNLVTYTGAGGRAFIPHYNYTWIRANTTVFPQTANWTAETKYFNGPTDFPMDADVNQTFQKGIDFANSLHI